MKQLVIAVFAMFMAMSIFAQAPSIGATQGWVRKYVDDYAESNQLKRITKHEGCYCREKGYSIIIEKTDHLAIVLWNVTLDGGIYGITNNTILAYNEVDNQFQGSGWKWDFTGTNIIANLNDGVVAIGNKVGRKIIFTDLNTNKICEAIARRISKRKAEALYAEEK